MAEKRVFTGQICDWFPKFLKVGQVMQTMVER